MFAGSRGDRGGGREVCLFEPNALPLIYLLSFFFFFFPLFLIIHMYFSKKLQSCVCKNMQVNKPSVDDRKSQFLEGAFAPLKCLPSVPLHFLLPSPPFPRHSIPIPPPNLPYLPLSPALPPPPPSCLSFWLRLFSEGKCRHRS